MSWCQTQTAPAACYQAYEARHQKYQRGRYRNFDNFTWRHFFSISNFIPVRACTPSRVAATVTRRRSAPLLSARIAWIGRRIRASTVTTAGAVVVDGNPGTAGAAAACSAACSTIRIARKGAYTGGMNTAATGLLPGPLVHAFPAA